MLKVEKNDKYKSNTFGRNVKYIRKTANYTQEEFSEKIGVTPQFLSSVERGVAGISIGTAIRICKIAKCSSNILFKGIIEIPNSIDKYEFLSLRDKVIINEMIEILLRNK